MLLKGKIALITGSSRGIGAATAKLFAKHGAQVAVNYFQNADAANSIVGEIKADGGTAITVQANVTIEDDVKRMIQTVTEKLGQIDILVINAGLSFKVAPFMEHSWDEFDAKLSGEIKAAFHCVRAVAPTMMNRGHGTIVAVSSGLSRRPGPGFSAHSTSKAALNAFVRSLALELGPAGIRINTVSPGLTETDATSWLPDEQKQRVAKMTPMGHVGQPEELAGAILMMACDETRFVTGAYLPVNGGMDMF